MRKLKTALIIAFVLLGFSSCSEKPVISDERSLYIFFHSYISRPFAYMAWFDSYASSDQAAYWESEGDIHTITMDTMLSGVDLEEYDEAQAAGREIYWFGKGSTLEVIREEGYEDDDGETVKDSGENKLTAHAQCISRSGELLYDLDLVWHFSMCRKSGLGIDTETEYLWIDRNGDGGKEYSRW